VTQAQYQKLTGKNPSYFRPGGRIKKVKELDTSCFPVEQVSWGEALVFCRELAELAEEKRQLRQYALPSEAQWEYACRAGALSPSPFHFGASLCSRQANFDGRHPFGGAAKGPYVKRPTHVGSYTPNAYGLLDLHGNVWEWCADWHAEDSYAHSPRKDPPGPPTGDSRVLRGGSWEDIAWGCRSASRNWSHPDSLASFYGFRVVCMLF
jgi:formylglycine-generating enzyme required for sulfatase activity